jgi:hypothetical protein
MHPKSFKIKVLAVFLVAFVCLNAGGFVCVAYCQTALSSVGEEQDHCPLKKKSSHCDPGMTADVPDVSDSAGTNKVECCRMAFSFIAAPLEKRTFAAEVTQAIAAVKVEPGPLAVIAPHHPDSTPAYRGPPLDRRGERLKHCIIRI